MKKAVKGIGIGLLTLILIIGISAGIFFLTYQSTMQFDFSQKTGAVKKGASGYLYGLAEDGVPSREMAESVDIKSIAQKVPGGLQHPIGDLAHTAPMLKQTDYTVVYLQDLYDTWYYKHDDIMAARADGSYDWQTFLNEDYLPKVQTKVTEMAQQSYPGKLVYCLYNECDNGVWFGETQPDENPDNQFGVWCDYNEIARENFNQAWKQTYDLVRSIDKNALIGGPGFCDYNRDEIEAFLRFCKENNCLPEVMIYHELAEREAYYFDDHIRDYRKLEKELGIAPLEIIITEYGMMNETGYPGKMVQYITQIEDNKVYADSAYWRLANNLNDTCADANTPNAEWWLMRWYTEMKGETVQGKNLDILSSDFANTVKYHYDSLSYNGFMGIASVSDEDREIDIVCGGGDRKSRVKLRHLDTTSLYGKKVNIRVEESVYKGLSGAVTKPVLIREYTATLSKSLTVSLGKTDSANAYHIRITEADPTGTSEEADARSVRYKFENGTLLGAAYTYDSYCPASGGNKEGHDLVGGMENEGDGVELTVDAPKDGTYTLDFIYGNSNDGAWDESGRQNPNDRADTRVKLSVDGQEEDIYLPNTIKSEYTSCYTHPVSLKKGTHKIRLTHGDGTYVLDSVVVTPKAENSRLAVLPDADRSTQSSAVYLAVAQQDGYYTVNAEAESFILDEAEITLDGGAAEVFLKRGLNYIALNTTGKLTISENEPDDGYADYQSAAQALRSGTANLKEIPFRNTEETMTCIDGISAKSGAAAFTFTAEQDGLHRLLIEYSNNDEGGVHDYNVDLIERYVTVTVNGERLGNYYCGNTRSWQTRSTVCITVPLKKGENIVALSNDGAERFDGKETFAPYLFGVGVFEVQR